MKKFLVILPVALCCGFGCKKQVQVERFMEEGVEVVVNHLEPYKLKGSPSNLILEKVFSIDAEGDDVAEIGLSDIGIFDVDSKGNIYVVNPKPKANIIFKFDKDGNYVHSFCRIGQGPGEMQYPPFAFNIISQNKIAITAIMKNALLIFDNEGNLIDETPISIKTRNMHVVPLSNGNYICYRFYIGSSDTRQQYTLALHDSEFKELKILDTLDMPDYSKGEKFKGIYAYCYKILESSIFVGNENRGYEIWMYDSEGILKRKIRKDYEKIPIPKEFIEEKLKAWGEQWREITSFPESFPPFQGFFTDDKGSLYVLTYEKGENPNEYEIDIFNADGIFVGRKSLRISSNYASGVQWATVKQNLLYCQNEKESGYKELVVYRMKWE